MIREREVKPERLDELPSDHPDAIQSRDDLKRLNWWMGNPDQLAKGVATTSGGAPIQTIVDLGGGDGAVLAEVLERLNVDCRRAGGVARIIDRRPCVSQANRKRLHERGWHVETIDAEVIEWLKRPKEPVADIMLANLFLHHFSTSSLRELLKAAATRCRCFIACEPSRRYRSLLLSKAIWVIGCHRVTRHDAPISVRAGFRGKELSRLWPDHVGWDLHEGPFGLSSHYFAARFQGGDP